MKEQIQEIRSNFVGRDINIYFDYIDSGILNAFATIEQGLGIIAFNRGAVLLPKDMFQRMLSHPEVLSEIGDNSVESMASQFGEGLPMNIDAMHKQRKKNGRPIFPPIPNDETRRAFAVTITQFAFDFLVIHELAHIALGHLGYRSCTTSTSTNRPVRIMEASSTSKSIDDNMILQAIEYGADNTAVGVTIERILNKDVVVDPISAQFFTTIEQRLYTWCFGISGLFHLWGVKIDLANIESSDHPPHAMRYALAINTAKSILQEMRPDIVPIFLDIANEAIKRTNEAVGLIGGIIIERSDIDPVYSPKGKAHHAKLRDIWFNEILPKLRQHSYVHIRDIKI